MMLGRSEQEHLAQFNSTAHTFDIVLARVTARGDAALCTREQYSDIVSLRMWSEVLLAHAASGAEAADKQAVQRKIIDAENVANMWVNKFAAQCLGKSPPGGQTPAAAAASSDFLGLGRTSLLMGLGGLLVGAGTVALLKR
jgi:hypothetical protein